MLCMYVWGAAADGGEGWGRDEEEDDEEDDADDRPFRELEPVADDADGATPLCDLDVDIAIVMLVIRWGRK